MPRQDKETRDRDSRTPAIQGQTRDASHLDVPTARDARAKLTKAADSPHSTTTPGADSKGKAPTPEPGRSESPVDPGPQASPERPLTGNRPGSADNVGIGAIDRDQPSTGASDVGLVDYGRSPDDEGVRGR